MNATQAAAKLILATLPTDPDAVAHWLELQRATGHGCAIQGCENTHRSSGFCDTHYRQHLRATRNEAHTINRKAAA